MWSQIYAARWAYFFLAPALLFYAVFLLYPLAQGLVLSLFDVGLSPVRKFVGAENFIRLAGDEKFRRAVGNTLVFVLGVVPTALALSLGIALLIQPLASRVQSFYRMAFYLPGVAGGVILALVWLWIYQPTYGLLNHLLGRAGIAPVAWLGTAETALPSLMFVVLTWILGQPIILFLAGLDSIPAELTEAARLDGAAGGAMLRRIILPLLRPTLLFVLITQTIGVMQVFVVVNVMTQGGPANATQTLVFRIYETAFGFYEYGYASAMGVVLLAIVAVVGAVQFRLLGRDAEA
ncbi:MAG: carbohydrate ABC transporter permease [Actinomycetota bacterium]